MVVCACHPSYTGNINMRITVQVNPGINMRTYFKNILAVVWLKR
jgi:hypothetical protein